MTKPLALLLLCACVILSGCGSFLASMESNTMEDDPGERTIGQQMDDETIETKSVVNMRAANEAFDDAHLVVVSYNGYVLLAGQVHNEALKTQATDVVRKIRNVRRIYNELEVASPSSTLTCWIRASPLPKSPVPSAILKISQNLGLTKSKRMLPSGEETNR